MKNAFTIILLASALQVSAQEDESRFKFGPRLGFNLAKVTEVDDASGKGGLVAGGYMVYSFQEHFGVSLDLLYSMEGGKFNSSETTAGTPPVTTKSDNTLSLSYLRVPLLFNYFAGQLGNPVRPKIFLGPCLGFLLGVKNESEVTVESGGVTTTATNTNTSKDGFNTTDFGALIGAGANFRLADRMWLDTDLGYYIGASEIYDGNTGDNDAPKNQHFQVKIGLGFGLNR